MLVHAARGNYDTAILVSGDTDFVAAVEAIKGFGRRCEIALFGPGRSSNAVRDVADEVMPLSEAFCPGLWLKETE